MFRVDSVEGNTQRLDGGAMFGNCPRPVWEKWAPPDSLNRIALACRGMLVRDGVRTVLVEAGIGAFFEPRLRERYGVAGDGHVLLSSLAGLGVAPEDVDAVVLSHLHFDHAGGLLAPWAEGQPARLAFPRARFVVGRAAWERARRPHPRDRASFIPELNALLEHSGRVDIAEDGCAALPPERWSFTFSDGHTPGLAMARVATPRGPVTFVGDLAPGVAWVHVPITMGYDRFPERLIDEKQALFERVLAEDGWLFFTHDPRTAACKLRRDAKGKFEATAAVERVAWSDGG